MNEQNDTPNGAVRDFLFEHNIRDEKLQSRLTAHIGRVLAPILQEHRAKQAEMLEKAEVERKAHIEATLQDIKVKRENKTKSENDIAAEVDKAVSRVLEPVEKQKESETISDVSSIDVQLEDGSMPKP